MKISLNVFIEKKEKKKKKKKKKSYNISKRKK